MGVTKRTLDQLTEVIGRTGDVFICCGSFELRCRSISDHLSPDAFKCVLVAENRLPESHVDEQSAYLRARFGDLSRSVVVDSQNPVLTADDFNAALAPLLSSGARDFLIDITTFTHEWLLILLRLLSLLTRSGDRVRLIYAGASSYGGSEDPEYKWLSKGVNEVRSVLGYPGEMLPSRRTHLVVLVGYEHERAARLIEEFEPNVISLGYGWSEGQESKLVHSDSRKFYETLCAKTQSSYADVRQFQFSSSDPWLAKQEILKEVAVYPDCNAVVAPMNSKISTVGAALAAMEVERIQLCYAEAVQYNHQAYSVPGEYFYLFEVGELIGLRQPD